MRGVPRMRRLVMATLAALALAAAAAAGPAAFATPAQGDRMPGAAQTTATVRVLHGVPGLTVDVFANGKKVLSDFTPGSLSAPLELPGGSYDIKVFKAGQG